MALSFELRKRGAEAPLSVSGHYLVRPEGEGTGPLRLPRFHLAAKTGEQRPFLDLFFSSVLRMVPKKFRWFALECLRGDNLGHAEP